jgi:hypothetical protein
VIGKFLVATPSGTELRARMVTYPWGKTPRGKMDGFRVPLVTRCS